MKKIEKQSKPILYRVIHNFFSHRFDLINLQPVAVNLCVITHKLKLPILVSLLVYSSREKEKSSCQTLPLYLIYEETGYARNECVILVVEDDEGDEEGRTRTYNVAKCIRRLRGLRGAVEDEEEEEESRKARA